MVTALFLKFRQCQSNRYRLAFFLMYMHGKNNHEIAEVMAIAEETVRVHKLRAIQSLKNRLGANEMLTRITSIL